MGPLSTVPGLGGGRVGGRRAGEWEADSVHGRATGCHCSIQPCWSLQPLPYRTHLCPNITSQPPRPHLAHGTNLFIKKQTKMELSEKETELHTNTVNSPKLPPLPHTRLPGLRSLEGRGFVQGKMNSKGQEVFLITYWSSQKNRGNG